MASSFLGNMVSSGDLAASLKSSLSSGIASVSVSLLDGIDPAISTAVRSSGLMNAVENVLNTSGLFEGAFNTLGRIASTAFSTAGDLVNNIFGGAKTFVELITERGPLGAMNNALNSLFTRQTVESVVAQGGVEKIISNPTTKETLPDGRVVDKITLTTNGSIYLGQNGEIAAIKEGGLTSTGTFVWTEKNGIQLKTGTIEGNTGTGFYGSIESGYNIRARVEEGKTTKIEITDKDNNKVVEVTPERPNTPIGINRVINPTTSEFTFSIMNALLYFANSYMAKVNQDMVESITQKVNAISAGSIFSNSNKFLYALANGIRNPVTSEYTPPTYIGNLMNDIYEHSNKETLPLKDMFPIPLYQGMTQWSEVDGIFDSVKWLAEFQLKLNNKLVDKAQRSIDAYFVAHPGEWNRPVVAMGYSGGFMPLAEAVSKGSSLLYNIKTLVGVGAPTAYLPNFVLPTLLQLMSAITANSLSLAIPILIGMGWGSGTINSIEDIKGIVVAKVRELVQQSNLSGDTFPITLSPKTDLIVNVWGTEDDFFKIGVVGKRDNFLGKITYNIEIKGASHTDYIRGIESLANPTWNNTVASFISDLMIVSKNKSTLDAFIAKKILDKEIYQDERGVYVVNLPGCGV